MSSDFQRVKLAEVVDSCLGKMLDQNKNKGDFLPYLGNSNVRWGKFDLSNLAQMRFETSESVRYGLMKGDLLVCEGGEPGRCAIWKDDIPNMKFQKALHRIRPNANVDNYYLYYWFLLSSRTGKLEPYFTGTTIKHLTGKALGELEIELPPISDQVKVSGILKCLDDKIETNEKINQTLEQIAQAMFKSWFVDFEPTRAKIAAKEAGGDQAAIEQAAMCAISGKTPDQLKQSPPETLAQLKATAALFPEALVDSELGEVPEGWFVKQLSELGNVVCGKTPPKDNPEFYGGDIPFIKIPDMHGRMYPTRTTDTLTAAGANTQIKKLLPRDSICVSCIATVGLVSLTCEDSFTNQQINTIVPNSDSYSQYIYFAMLDLNGHLHDLASGGSATLNLNTGHFSKIKIVFPVDEVVDNFSNQVKPMFDLILRQSFEIDLLERVRDSLLPKLLSGELDSLEILEQSI